MSRLFFKMYNAGLSNCRMSLDIGVGLSYLTGRTFAPYGIEAPWSSNPHLLRGEHYAKPSTVLDLFHVPGKIDSAYRGKKKIREPGLTRPWAGDVHDAAFLIDGDNYPESDDFRSFRNGRDHSWLLASALAAEGDLLLDRRTLGMYSYFFHGNPARLAGLRSLLSRIRPKRPYRELAGRIANTLAPFHAVHIRRGDFGSSQLSPRAASVTSAEIAKNLARRLSAADRLLICTDTPDPEWFAPLLKHFKNAAFLDRVLLDGEWSSEFRALPFHDDTVLALLTQLIAEQAECFLGTPFSSFTALIQRARGFRGREPAFLFCYSDWDSKAVPFKNCEFVPVQDGPYTWNRILYPVLPGVHSWFREWPEAFEEAADARGPSVVPADAVLLPACDAHIEGSEARYERSHMHDNIGYWTNPDDYVCWEFDFQRSQSCFVEIRYAAPACCAGSAFEVQVDRGESLSGCTSATEDWIVYSSWRRLGKVMLHPGRHQLTLRILNMPGYAAMNLAGIRLSPVSALEQAQSC